MLIPKFSVSATAVLFSAGLDSAVLAAREAIDAPVQPIYVSTGLAWEAQEMAAVEQLLATPLYSRLAPIARLAFPVGDLYPPAHWALRGSPPGYDTPDEDVYLTGRNIILLSKAGIYCAQHRIGRIALGPLAGNPFPDATPSFFDAMSRTLTLGLAGRIDIVTPLASMHKSDVIRLGAELGVPFALTLSCMNPRDGRHCGGCSKCRERRVGFRAAGIADPTDYGA
jgi:7-cyano-7-deazaguanine synthase